MSMPAPPRTEIRTAVIQKLNSFTEPEHPITDDDEGEKVKLWGDLGLSATMRSALSVPFTKIVRRYNEKKSVSPSEAGECKTVKDSVEVVFKKVK